MKLPYPAVIESQAVGGVAFAPDLRQEVTNDSSIVLTWDRDTENPHMLQLVSLEDKGDVTGVVAGGRDFPILIRPIDPYDAILLSDAGVPQPVEVIKAQILSGGTNMAAQELSAVVMPDNTVATLMLETGLGVYVRYLGDWQLLNPQSNALEDAELVDVGPGALAVWDAADTSGSTITVFDLPTNVNGEQVLPADVLPQVSLTGEPAVSTGEQIPVIASAADVQAGIAMARRNPLIRWYVRKRADALGEGHRVPEGW